VADIGDPAKVLLPVDIPLSSEDDFLWVDTFSDGSVRLFDIRDPFHPRQVYEKRIGAQFNMVSQSWDGNGCTSRAELGQEGRGQRAVPEGLCLGRQGPHGALCALDFTKEKLGRPHIMRFGARSLYTKAPGAVPLAGR
jgi:selenium-binding protein 1